MGDLGAETFLLLVSAALERVEDELELKLVVVLPLRTMLVGAKEETDISWSGQKESILLEEMRKHEDDSRSWKMRLSQRLDCPELGIHKVEVCD